MHVKITVIKHESCIPNIVSTFTLLLHMCAHRDIYWCVWSMKHIECARKTSSNKTRIMYSNHCNYIHIVNLNVYTPWSLYYGLGFQLHTRATTTQLVALVRAELGPNDWPHHSTTLPGSWQRCAIVWRPPYVVAIQLVLRPHLNAPMYNGLPEHVHGAHFRVEPSTWVWVRLPA